MGAACSWLVNIITLSSLLYSKCTYVYATPLLNEIKLQLHDANCAQRAAILFVGSCLATKVFIGKLPGTGEGWLSDSNWGAFNHASHAPQLLSDNYYVYVVAYSPLSTLDIIESS